MSRPWIRTATGGRFYYDAPTPEMVNIQDIATALSHECRYGGHCRRFYSVAEHSVHVMRVVAAEPTIAALVRHGRMDELRAALLHDAPEAYCKDIPRPLKILLPEYRAIEARVDAAIRAKFGIGHEHDDLVHWADMAVFRAETRQVQAVTQAAHEVDPGGIDLSGDVANITVSYLDPVAARDLFLRTWQSIGGVL